MFLARFSHSLRGISGKSFIVKSREGFTFLVGNQFVFVFILTNLTWDEVPVSDMFPQCVLQFENLQMVTCSNTCGIWLDCSGVFDYLTQNLLVFQECNTRIPYLSIVLFPLQT